MTEKEWMECEEPLVMMRVMHEFSSPRRARLLACACCRRVWHLLSDERSRKAIEVAEQYADGVLHQAELKSAWNQADKVKRDVFPVSLCDAARRTACPDSASASDALYYIACAIGRNDPDKEAEATAQSEKTAQCILLRDIIGNPFRSTAGWSNASARPATRYTPNTPRPNRTNRRRSSEMSDSKARRAVRSSARKTTPS